MSFRRPSEKSSRASFIIFHHLSNHLSILRKVENTFLQQEPSQTFPSDVTNTASRWHELWAASPWRSRSWTWSQACRRPVGHRCDRGDRAIRHWIVTDHWLLTTDTTIDLIWFIIIYIYELYMSYMDLYLSIWAFAISCDWWELLSRASLFGEGLDINLYCIYIIIYTHLQWYIHINLHIYVHTYQY